MPNHDEEDNPKSGDGNETRKSNSCGNVESWWLRCQSLAQGNKSTPSGEARLPEPPLRAAKEKGTIKRKNVTLSKEVTGGFKRSRDHKEKQEIDVKAPATNNDDAEWLGLFNNAEDLKVYRIRQFIQRARCVDGEHGREPNLFAVHNDCLLNSTDHMLLDRFPFYHDIPHHEVTNFLENRGKSAGMGTAQWNKDILFIGMPKGSIVALTIPNKIGQVDVAFGAVRMEYPRHVDGFPISPKFDDIIHFIVRKVSGMRIAKLRDLPGQESGINGANYVKWLHESSPSFLLELKDKVKDKAFKYLQSQEFLQCSTNDFSDLI